MSDNIEGQAQQGAAGARRRTYCREPEVELQLRGLTSLPASLAVAAALRDEKDTARRPREETLVALCRQLYASGESELAWRLALALAVRVKNHVARAVRLWRLDRPESLASDVVDGIVSGLYDAVFDTSHKSKFWEVRFWVAFDRRMISTLRDKRLEVERTTAYGAVETDSDGESYGDELPATDEARGLAGGLVLDLTDPVVGTMVAEALASLPERQRIAYILKYAAGMPEDSVRDGCATIATVLGVSGRAVRTYLRRAEAALAEWRGER